MLSLGEILKLLAPADLQAFVKRGLTVAFVCVFEMLIAMPHSLDLAEMGYIVHLYCYYFLGRGTKEKTDHKFLCPSTRHLFCGVYRQHVLAQHVKSCFSMQENRWWS